MYDSIYITFSKRQYYGDGKQITSYQGLQMVGQIVMGMAMKGQHVRDFCGHGVVLYLDCAGGYINLNM